MTFRNTLIPALYLAMIVGLFHIEALRYHLYWHSLFTHIAIHFLAGLTIGLTALYVFSHLSTATARDTVAFIVVLAFALAWEVFEYQNGLIYASGGVYVLDTIRGVAVGLVGGAAAILYVHVRKNFRS